MKLSVLMSIYYKEDPLYFNQAMESIWDSQTLKPNEIILVEDGVLSEELYIEIAHWKEKLGNILTIVKLKDNVGLAKALNVGLDYCNGDFIARMDSDDISMPSRFKTQIDFLKTNLDIQAVGTWISEIDENNNVIKDLVRYPLYNDELFTFFKLRDPIVHPTSMFRNTFFEKVGKYRDDVHLAEDTLLWYEAFKNKCKIANIDYIGLQFRRNKQFYKRRANIKKSIQLLKCRVFEINPTLEYGIVANFYAIAYFAMSLSPSFIKKFLYQISR